MDTTPGGKPKVEGRKFRRPTKPIKREFLSTTQGLEKHTFDVGNAKYAAKFQKLLDAISIHIQANYKDGSKTAKSVRDLKLLVITLDAYPAGVNGGPPDAGTVYLWQQEVSEQAKARNLLAET